MTVCSLARDRIASGRAGALERTDSRCTYYRVTTYGYAVGMSGVSGCGPKATDARFGLVRGSRAQRHGSCVSLWGTSAARVVRATARGGTGEAVLPWGSRCCLTGGAYLQVVGPASSTVLGSYEQARRRQRWGWQDALWRGRPIALHRRVSRRGWPSRSGMPARLAGNCPKHGSHGCRTASSSI